MQFFGGQNRTPSIQGDIPSVTDAVGWLGNAFKILTLQIIVFYEVGFFFVSNASSYR